MWLVLADRFDSAAAWLVDGLRVRGVEPLEFVTIDELVRSTRWRHTVGVGGAHFVASIDDGRTIDSVKIDGVINRVGFVPPLASAHVVEDDAEYVTQELSAFYLSVFASMPGLVMNPPSPRGLGGSWRHQSEWVSLAARAGLPHAPFRASDAPEVPADPSTWTGPMAITVSGEIVDTGLRAELQQGCLRLAELAQTPMLGIQFECDPAGHLIFGTASPRPPLERAGDAILDAITHVFLERSEQ